MSIQIQEKPFATLRQDKDGNVFGQGIYVQRVANELNSEQ